MSEWGKWRTRPRVKARQLGKPHRKGPALAGAIAVHFAMGVAIGMAFALALVLDKGFGLSELILRSDAPRTASLIVLGTFAATFGVGAALTGFVFIMMEQE